jgi:hypothetical protein
MKCVGDDIIKGCKGSFIAGDHGNKSRPALDLAVALGFGEEPPYKETGRDLNLEDVRNQTLTHYRYFRLPSLLLDLPASRLPHARSV